MTGGLALGPQGLASAAVEHDAAARERAFERFPVHVAEHQHLAVARVLHDCGQQPVALGPVEPLQPLRVAHVRISSWRSRRNRFKSPISIAPLWNTLAASAPSTPATLNTSAKCSGA